MPLGGRQIHERETHFSTERLKAERRAGKAERRAGKAERRAGKAERRAGKAERRAGRHVCVCVCACVCVQAQPPTWKNGDKPTRTLEAFVQNVGDFVLEILRHHNRVEETDSRQSPIIVFITADQRRRGKASIVDAKGAVR
jgi:hypothetical protein